MKGILIDVAILFAFHALFALMWFLSGAPLSRGPAAAAGELLALALSAWYIGSRRLGNL